MKNSTKTYLRVFIYAFVTLVLLLTVFVLGYCKEKGCIKENLFYLIFINILPATASITGVAAIWEAFSKRSFAKEVLELTDVSCSYEKSGIIAVYDNFTDIDWIDKFKYAKEVTIFFSYGSSWRSENRKSLQHLKKENAKINVILPNYKDDSIVDNLNRRFNYSNYAKKGSAYSNKNVKNEIIQAEQDFKNKYGANVYLYNGTITSSYYLIDDICIFAPFNHSKEQGSVPAIECKKDGVWYKYCKKDLDDILKELK